MRPMEGQCMGDGKKRKPVPVKTTIVGGRPDDSGRSQGDIPKGIEELLQRASRDRTFRRNLLARRSAVADDIGYELDPTEIAILEQIPHEQLEAAIDSVATNLAEEKLKEVAEQTATTRRKLPPVLARKTKKRRDQRR